VGAQAQGADATQGRWLVMMRTLSLVRYGDEILLLKRGAHKRVFPNRYNGLGGHIERGEDPATSARREIWEEAGLAVRDLRLGGVVHIDAKHESGILLFVYTATALSRTVKDSDEGTLEWVALAHLADKDIVEDIPLFIARLFTSPPPLQPFSARVFYDEADQMHLIFAHED